MHDTDHWVQLQQPDEGEILRRVWRRFRLQGGQQDLGAYPAHQQRVAVGRGIFYGGGADRAVRARLVDDDDGLSENVLRGGGQVAGRHVGVAARAEGNDELDRFGGIGLGGCRAGNRGEHANRGASERARRNAGKADHGRSPVVLRDETGLQLCSMPRGQ
ncbi:hypothetical protein D9M68_758170 [compost metagenome]